MNRWIVELGETFTVIHHLTCCCVDYGFLNFKRLRLLLSRRHLAPNNNCKLTGGAYANILHH